MTDWWVKDLNLEIEGLHQGRLFQSLAVTHTTQLHALHVTSNTELRVFPDTVLENVC